MSDPIFVIDSGHIADNIEPSRAFVVRVDTPQAIPGICREYGSQADLREYLFHGPSMTLGDIDVDAAWGRNKITLVLEGLGRYADVWGKLRQLANTAVTLVFTGGKAALDARIAASLDVDAGVLLAPGMEITDDLVELVTYAFYGKMAHAAVQPFTFIEENYSNSDHLSPARFYHFEPGLYYHADSARNIALSHEALLRQEYIGRGYDAVTGCDAQVDAARHAWQRFLIDGSACASCPAFRVCSGFFEPQNKEGRCRELMMELLEGIEFKRGSEDRG